jgi:hypothetical protein
LQVFPALADPLKGHAAKLAGMIRDNIAPLVEEQQRHFGQEPARGAGHETK